MNKNHKSFKMSQEVYQKREICLLDIHKDVEKNHIDRVLKKNYQVVTSKMEKRVNVEFRTANIAKEVGSFLHMKELNYKNKPFKFQLRGNRFIIDGMNEVPFGEIRAFFSNYGEVNNVYYTKKYFATLASIGQAIELVEEIGVMKINGRPVEIKFAFDRNIGNSNSPNKNFKVKDIKLNESKLIDLKNNKEDKVTVELAKKITESSQPILELGKKGDNLVDLTKKLDLNASKSNLNGTKSNGGRSNLSGSRSNLSGSKLNVNSNMNGSKSNLSGSRLNISQNMNGNLSEGKNARKKRTRRGKKRNESENSDSSNFSANDAFKSNSKATSLVTNPNVSLFAKGPMNNSNGFSALDKLDYKSKDFKQINYLQEKEKNQNNGQPETIVRTYYNASNQPKLNSATTANFYEKTSNALPNSATKLYQPLLPTPPTNSNNSISKPVSQTSMNTGPASNNLTSKPNTIPKQPLVNQAPSPPKVNHFASPNKPKKEDACVIS